jgi:bile acid:Na+ symporter, BASS family
MLAFVMFGTGVTLKFSDFTSFVETNFYTIPLGVLCQFIIMPFTSYMIGRLFLYPISTILSTTTTTATSRNMLAMSTTRLGNELFLGLLSVGCSPGGTASNLVSYIAQANVTLSVLLLE